MNIIFGDDAEIANLRDRFVVLELDTFRTTGGKRHTVYGLIENIPLEDFPVIQSYIQVHHDLLQAYRDRNWEYCRSALDGLHGKWNGELDSFYQDLAQRVLTYQQQPPESDWDGSRITSFLEESGHRDTNA
jgi:hypothetical protein